MASCAGDCVLLADVGNTRIKLAAVAKLGRPDSRRLPTVTLRQDLLSRTFRPENLETWLAATAPGAAVMLVAGVNETAAVRLEAVVAEVSATGVRSLRQRRIQAADLPLALDVAEPGRVGIDRLAGAAAAAVAKTPGRGAVVVDCGTATTVDLVSAAGVFLGGAILAGPGLLARALRWRRWKRDHRRRCRAAPPRRRSRQESAGACGAPSRGSWPKRARPSAAIVTCS